MLFRSELKLETISAHIGYDALMNNLDKELEYLNILGAKFIVCPGAEMKTVDSALKRAEEFNVIGEKAKKAGLILGYHNHDHELVLDNGKYPLEVFFENTDPAYVAMQPDLFWVAYAGLDPINYVIKHKERIPVVHFKQIKDMETKANVDAGSGIIDFKKVTELLPNATYIYEQEQYIGTSMEDAKKSIDFLKNM